LIYWLPGKTSPGSIFREQKWIRYAGGVVTGVVDDWWGLRKKMPAFKLETIYGHGYRMVKS
jgi:hypothetical protein